MYCPNCRSEYREGFTVCSDCNVDLVNRLPNDEKEETEEINVVKIESTSNEIDAGIIMNLLKNNNIPCFKKSNGAGGYFNIIWGYSVFGEDIYIAERDYQRAREILDCRSEEVESIETDDTEPEERVPFYRDSRMVASIIIIANIAMAILIWILNKI